MFLLLPSSTESSFSVQPKPQLQEVRDTQIFINEVLNAFINLGTENSQQQVFESGLRGNYVQLRVLFEDVMKNIL